MLRRCLYIAWSALLAAALLFCEGRRTILDQDVEALLDEQVIVEHDETEREREHIVACPDFEEFANPPLFDVLAQSRLSATLLSAWPPGTPHRSLVCAGNPNNPESRG